ncbi:hypothetical protein O181_040336 [Austropuccinia psidii MF-1]|uniref:Reverse transcriptase Ty1/copia-type domain-containing protein n=1 Tax=Austropuccinia psidii MF-1 TaxID=1389203 RepID=A0A9Q3HDA7_9BASI|nr:hypothetical protein [Austropuccinia psidii MF-1]
MFFDKTTFPSISSQNTISTGPDLRSLFPYSNRNPRESTDMTLPKPIAEQLELLTKEEEEQESLSEAPELQPSRINVIGPRHPTLISSDIDPANILSFRRTPRINLTQTRVDEVSNSYNKALSGLNKEKWAKAIQTKLRNMEKLKVWTPRSQTTDRKPITCTWTFKIKKNATGNPVKYKAHLCAQSFQQIPGIYYQHTFSPTGQLTSLLTLISFAASNHYQFHQMDVKSAFLNAPLKEDMAIEVPQGLTLNKNSLVLQVNKVLYGLKQSPVAWNNHLSKWLIGVNFTQSIPDPCVFWKSVPDPIWIYVHVDDLASFSPNFYPLKKLIQKHFEIEDLAEANLLL